MHVPYFELRLLSIGPFLVPTFAVMMAIAMVTANLIMIRRARRLGLNAVRIGDLSLAMVVAGLAGAVLFKLLYTGNFYRHDLMTLVKKHLALSSIGGILGGSLGAWAFFRFTRTGPQVSWRYLDVAAFAFPFGWIFGRLGCFLVHDHPGIRSESILAVAYPSGTRFDLAFLEILFISAIIVVFLILDRSPRPTGFFLCLFFALYGPFRIALDQLHIDPPRYFGITVDQFAGALLTALSVLFFVLIRRPAVVPSGDAPEAPGLRRMTAP